MTHPVLPALAIVIVSWNTRDLLYRCIASIKASLRDSSAPYAIIVVDNDSHDGTTHMLRSELPEIELIESAHNLGFAGGNNQALRRLAIRNWQLKANAPDSPQAEAVLLLNPDTEVVADAIDTMRRYLAAHPDVAVVGPRLRYADGSVQSSRRRLPTPGTFLFESTPLEQRVPRNRWVRRYHVADRSDDEEQDVDWLVGAALMVRRDVIERAGLLDAGFHMYSEELEWQRRIGAGSRPNLIVYLPGAEITHYEGKSSEQALAQRYLNFHTSRLRYAEMTHGARLRRRVRTFLRVAYGAELLTEAAKWLLGHKRPMRARRIGMYSELLRRL
jgi:GT2 family glycosyltransferase